MTGTRRKRLLAGAALSLVAAGAVAAIVGYRSSGREASETDEQAMLSELIRRLGAVESASADPEAEALRLVLEKLERAIGESGRHLRRRLSKVRNRDSDLDEATLAHIEYLVEKIEEGADRGGS